MASLMHFRRKMNKSLALSRLPVWHEGLKTGVVAAIERLACLSDLDFSTSIDVGANIAPGEVEAAIGAAA